MKNRELKETFERRKKPYTNRDCCEKWLSYFLLTSDWNGMNFLTARNWNVAGGMELRNVMSGMVRNGMMERVRKAGNVVYID